VEQHGRGGVYDRVLEFLAQYGDRGLAVLRAAVEAASSPRARGVRLGDFSYRDVVQRLRSWGITYNPSTLLRILERDYGVIETSYRSSGQHWYRFINLDEVVEALDAYEHGVDVGDGDGGEPLDPEVELLIVQIASLDPHGLLERLRRLARRPRLGSTGLQQLRQLAFNELAAAARLLRRAEELGYEGPEVELLREALSLASRIARRLLAAGGRSSQAAAARAAAEALGGLEQVRGEGYPSS